jgi:Mg2+ and Co2+ transporter CorA
VPSKPEQVLELDEDQPFDTGNYQPEGKRLWSWLVLCDDGTVISIHEPLPLDISQKELVIVRHNLFTVFRSLSISHTAEASTSDSQLGPGGGGLDDLPFRHLHTQHASIHGDPSLLFYYLFDDWYSSYDFVVGRGAPYSTRMRNLRNEMHREPKLSHLSTLHSLTRQLSILKRLYESKRVILDNILYRQENSTSTVAPPHRKQSNNVFSPDELYTQTMGDSGLLGVPLDPLAIAKFERLRDRIKLYVLGELSALLEEKVELENLTFNLISLRQSDTVAVLTRVTIWLTKFTFVFLPLTLVTGYFSMQLKDLEGRYNSGAFWGTAGVTIALTAVVLYTVGKSTDTMDLWEMWRAVKRVWFDGLVFWNRKRDERKEKAAKQWEVSS